MAVAERGLGRLPHEPYPASDLLRFSTAGSVDDGKSTLIGRLLHDSKGIFEDQLAALELATRRRGGDGIDLALLTDGLRAEREQGITIDVAYRYFATPRRKFIVADTPGHLQYTRNMVTGASTADLAIILVDARSGVVEQTRRHLVIAALLRVPHLVVAVNKMDLVEFAEDQFDPIEREIRTYASGVGIGEITVIPVSALRGDNVVTGSPALAWYRSPALLEHLETVERPTREIDGPLRMPIQWVIRDRTNAGYRAFAGRIERGRVRTGDLVTALPSNVTTRIEAIDTFDDALEEAFAPLSVAIRLVDDVDLGRGGLIAAAGDAPEPRRELLTTVCWLGATPLTAGRRYRLSHGTQTVRAVASSLDACLDINSLELVPEPDQLAMNEIGRVRLTLAEPIFADSYRESRSTGSAILVDEATNETVGAVLIQDDDTPWP
ncbi:MAG TPA: GTP-binding protein [Candidatus Limnocylindrales bacterium]|nr:GTP-binding protein [Candidatus Limnocylindrales bacterium]